jgi:putative ABC transport system permease protein
LQIEEQPLSGNLQSSICNLQLRTAMVQDLRYAFRSLLRTPGFTLTAVVTLALGIGANTAIFTMIWSVLLRPLPYPEPERLASVEVLGAGKSGPVTFGWSYPRFEDLRRFQRAFEQVAAYSPMDVNLTGTAWPERLAGEMVSPEYFPVLRVTAARGRLFTHDDSQIVLLSDALWRSRYAADPAVIGQTIQVNQIPFTAAGILPPDFQGLSGRTALWLPMAAAPALTGNPRRLTNAMSFWHRVVARTKPGVTWAQAAEDMKSVQRQTEEVHPSPRLTPLTIQARSLLESKTVPGVRRALWVLFGAAGFVLLIACGNLASLLSVRAVVRRPEVAVRLSLGASRAALIRQFLTESMILAVAGGVAGLLVALWTSDLLAVLRPAADRGAWAQYARALSPESLRLTAPAAAFNFLLALVTGVLFGLAPAWRASRPNLAGILRGAERGARSWSARSLLVASQLAMAVVLLSAAGLMIRTFRSLLHVPIGFHAEGVLTLNLELPLRQYRQTAYSFYSALLGRVAALPGVESAAIANALPVSGQTEASVLQVEGRPESHPANVHMVSPGFFAALRIPLLRGRLPDLRDGPDAPKAAWINATAARLWFPNEDPVGKRVSTAGWGQSGDLAEIAGVVGDVKYEEVEKPVEADIYVPLAQWHYNTGFLVVRAAGDPAALATELRRQVLALDKDLPVFDVKTMEERLAAVTSRTRFSAQLLAAFSLLALALAAVGIYGVVSYAVAARTHEIGIRMALGARAEAVRAMVLGQGLRLAVAGLLAGLPAAWAGTRLLAAFLHGVSPGDPATLAAVAALLLAVALAACYLPARRASRVDPLVALRYE